MNPLKSVAAAFAMFSRIPMPRVDWDDKSLRYLLCAFPLVGTAAGLALWGWLKLTLWLGLDGLLWGAGLCLIPVLISGGVHLDGFCDTADALASHAPTARKLEILEDSHVGAFAAIALGCYLLAAAALGSALAQTQATVLLLGLGLMLSRALSGLCVLLLPSAKNRGLGHTFSTAGNRPAVVVLALTIAALAAGLVALSPLGGGLMLAAAAATVWGYRRMALRQFGGATGDLAGWFLQLCELGMTAALLVAQQLI